MKPAISYTIWFGQRTGSTLLTKALEATGVAGRPGEWFNCGPDLLNEFHLTSYAALQQHLWELGSTANGIFRIKHSAGTADEVSEEWVQRFREERQKGWPNLGW